MNLHRVARLAALTVGLMLPALVRADVALITTATPDSATAGVVTTFFDKATPAAGNHPAGTTSTSNFSHPKVLLSETCRYQRAMGLIHRLISALHR